MINDLLSYKTIILDCDGVILDSNELKTKGFIKLLDSYPKEMLDKFIHYHIIKGGVSRQVKLEYFLRRIVNDYSEEKHRELVQDYGIIINNLLQSVQLTEGAKEFLKKYSKSSQLFVVSGGKQTELHDIFKKLNIFNFFKNIFGNPLSKEENMKKINEMGSLNGEMLFIGDAIKDYEVAKKFHCDFIFIKDYSDLQDKDKFIKSNSIFAVETLKDLI